eukprot:13634238-Heterocapsa_arctica.AAC.1
MPAINCHRIRLKHAVAYQSSNQTKKSGRQALAKRSSSGRYVPGNVVGWEIQANPSFEAVLTSNKHRRRFQAEEAPSTIAWNYKLGCRGRTISWDRVVTRRKR